MLEFMSTVLFILSPYHFIYMILAGWMPTVKENVVIVFISVTRSGCVQTV